MHMKLLQTLIFFVTTFTACSQELEDALKATLSSRTKLVKTLESMTENQSKDEQYAFERRCKCESGHFKGTHERLGEIVARPDLLQEKRELFEKYKKELHEEPLKKYSPFLQRMCIKIARGGCSEYDQARDLFFWLHNPLIAALQGSIDREGWYYRRDKLRENFATQKLLIELGSQTHYVEGDFKALHYEDARIDCTRDPLFKNAVGDSNAPLLAYLCTVDAAKYVNKPIFDCAWGFQIKAPVTAFFYTFFQSLKKNSEEVKSNYEIMRVLLHHGAVVSDRDAFGEYQFLPEFVRTLNRPLSKENHALSLEVLDDILQTKPDDTQLRNALTIARTTAPAGWDPVKKLMNSVVKDQSWLDPEWSYLPKESEEVKSRMTPEAWLHVQRRISRALRPRLAYMHTLLDTQLFTPMACEALPKKYPSAKDNFPLVRDDNVMNMIITFATGILAVNDDHTDNDEVNAKRVKHEHTEDAA